MWLACFYDGTFLISKIMFASEDCQLQLQAYGKILRIPSMKGISLVRCSQVVRNIPGWSEQTLFDKLTIELSA